MIHELERKAELYYKVSMEKMDYNVKCGLGQNTLKTLAELTSIWEARELFCS